MRAECSIDSDMKGSNSAKEIRTRAIGSRTVLQQIIVHLEWIWAWPPKNVLTGKIYRRENIYGLGYRLWEFTEVYLFILHLGPKYFSFFHPRILLLVRRPDNVHTFVYRTNGKLFSFLATSLRPLSDNTTFPVLFQCFPFNQAFNFYFFVFWTINIVDAFIYGAFWRQRRRRGSENYVSGLK